VVELAWAFPASWRTRDGQGKWPLRQLLQRYLPRELFERPKAGFGVPLAQWLRGELRDWAAALLDPVRLEQQGLLRSEPIGRKWQEHQAGEHDWQYLLWDVLMLQAWLEARDTPPPAAG
jgi:asparagine synthase (glutamine-hydrolysing)